ncbi:MAG TPA: DUF2784 domain-containing protein [Gemmatimonadales bacterium]|nr:DUF2784 domain-containing protein [Gemmatimonadales bacterium]
MLYRVLADGIMLLHFAYIVFVIGGAILVLQRRWWMWLHLPAVAWGVWVEFFAKTCPLTPLENALRARAGQLGYAGGFIDHYVTRLVYPDGLMPRGQVVLGAFVIVVNAVLYWLVWRRARGNGVTTSPHSRIDWT